MTVGAAPTLADAARLGPDHALPQRPKAMRRPVSGLAERRRAGVVGVLATGTSRLPTPVGAVAADAEASRECSRIR